MKTLKNTLIISLMLSLCITTYAQDIIYTISGEIDNQKTSLDSIAIENLTKQTLMGFGNLPERNDYRINLSKSEFWGSTSVHDFINQSGFHLVKNLPGTLVVAYRGQNRLNANISLHNINGQRLALKENQLLENGSLIEVEIGNAGIYFLTISTPLETRSFKATGLLSAGNMSIATQNGTSTPLKSGEVYTLAGTGTDKGDNVRVSVFKGGYLAQPVELSVDGNETLVFPLEAQTPPEVQTLEATNIQNNSTTLNGYVTSDGGSSIAERGFYWSIGDGYPGADDNVEIVDGTTGSFSKQLTVLLPGTQYSFTAFAKNSKGVATGVSNLFVTDAPQQVDIPVLTAPTNYAVFNRISTATVNIQWDAVSGANEYWLNVFPSGQAGAPVFNEAVGNNTNKSISIDNLPNGVYIFQVRARATSGEWSNYSDAREFVADTLPGAPSLTTPANAASITQNTEQNFSWDAPSSGINRYYLRIVNGTELNGTPVYEGEPTSTNQNINCNWPAGIYTWSVRAIKNTPANYSAIDYENTIGWGDYAMLRTFTIAEALTIPTVSTSSITDITQTTATSGGNVTSDGSATVTARGVCWNTTGNPTTSNNKTTNGTGTGSWVSELTGLQPNTTYYIRAYATNSQGTAYGEQKEFSTLEEVSGEWPRGTETAVVLVTNPATGKTWMDRNLGASRAATSSTDEEAYGDLYQWGRAADGHQKRNSPTTTTLSTSDTPEHGNFILSLYSPWDWRSPQNTNLWQGVNGTNNPCPSGYRLPTYAELEAERQSWSSNNAAGAFASPLKLPMAGYRSSSNGSLNVVGSAGFYWSSTVGGDLSRHLRFHSSDAGTINDRRAHGYSVRCLKDSGTSVSFPTVTTTAITSITQTTATSGGNIATDGGATVTARGVCLNTTGNPTTANSKTTNGSGTGSFISNLTGLTANTTYYVRAYATNSQGTAYGEQNEFMTLEEVSGDWPRDTETVVVDVTNPTTGKTWMDRNLGASRAATSSTDAEAYGDLYQWGRSADGHQKHNSSTTSSLSTSDTPGHGNFILSGSSANWDWRSPQNSNLWQSVNGINNPCPSGYRLPTAVEWDSEVGTWSIYNANGAFASPLKLPRAGYRDGYNGKLYKAGTEGLYWSRSIDEYDSKGLLFSYHAWIIYQGRGYGYSIRCIKN